LTVKVKNKKSAVQIPLKFASTLLCLIRVLRRLLFEFALTRGRTKIIRPSLVFGLTGGILLLDLHSANRVCLLCHF
jgi:hypothetical protein